MRPMRKLPTFDRIREILTYDPSSGTFTRACDRGKWKAGQLMGSKSADGYLNISVDYVIYRAHRIAWLYMTGDDPQTGIDHINGDPIDNRWSNLRLARQAENLLNKKVQSNNKLGIKGVYKIKSGRFVARVNRKGKYFYLGVFRTADEAKAAYDGAAKVIHGEFFRS